MTTKRSKPLYDREQRVKWFDGKKMCAGVIKDIHHLGGHGYAYEIKQDEETLPVEITEAELSEDN